MSGLGPVLLSRRLSLRPAMLADAQEIFAVTPGLPRYLSFDPADSIRSLQATIASWEPAIAAGTDLHMALRQRETGEFIRWLVRIASPRRSPN